MKPKIKMIAVTGVLLFLWGGTEAFATVLQITCMEMFRGTPSVPVVYSFNNATGELHSDKYEKGPLSTFNEAMLDHTVSEKGGSTSFSVHTWMKKGETLRRVVRWTPDKDSKEKPWSFAEIYDFKKQTVSDEKEKKDTCHHNLYKAGE
jgi:hypothetical protein